MSTAAIENALSIRKALRSVSGMPLSSMTSARAVTSALRGEMRAQQT